MASLRGATARDRWMELADEARTKRQEALAGGNHYVARLWDEHERTMLRNAYEDVPFLDDTKDDGASETGFDPESRT